MDIYLVGGAVRDKLLHLSVKDKDWVVVGSNAEILLNKGYKQVGKEFPVFIHPKTREEYALARTERKSGVGYHGFKVNCSSKITLEEDLIRRDLTINAIAQDQYGNYIDPCNGKKDLKLGILRHISSSFKEDPLRVLRVARFAATFNYLGFRIARKTMLFMSDIVKSRELSYLKNERIWKETEKALMTSHPHVYFQVLRDCQALSILFPEIDKLYSANFSVHINNYITNINNFFFMALAKVSKVSKKIDIRFSCLCQFLSIGFSSLYNKKKYEFYDNFSASLIKRLCKRLHVPSDIQDLAVLISGFSNFLYGIFFQTTQSIMIFFDRIDAWRKPERIDKLVILINFYADYLNLVKLILSPGAYLKNIFCIAKSVSIKSILQSGFTGIGIKSELTRLRIILINKWRLFFLNDMYTNILENCY
ncbi:multifunctional CCA addition/repair protein [Buchnera aphidicola]|uniref:multifunctional CCA addition/repair protein n=1 Tax=Buchnera aphidicola TaxID=9 RepID=UPI003463AAEA